MHISLVLLQISISINKPRVKKELFPALDKMGYNYYMTKDEKCRINDFQLYKDLQMPDNSLNIAWRAASIPKT